MLDIFLDFVGTEKRSILFSTHITSDLEKIADYIVLIHKGKILLTEEKDKIVYHYGVMRCGKGQFNAMEENDKLLGAGGTIRSTCWYQTGKRS